MNTNLRFIPLVALLAACSGLHAEGNCPPGYYQTGAAQGQAGPQGCAPIPDNTNAEGSSLSPSPPPPEWQDRWGAIATDGPGGHLGASKNAMSRSVAEAEALESCSSKGGSKCQIENTYANACVVMVVGDVGHNSSSAPTLGEAINLGMDTCHRSDSHCQVFYSACSFPVRVR